jgi:Tfp pilus assembly protein PilN
VLGVLAACVAGTAAYVLTNNTIEQSKTDLASVNQRRAAVEAQSAKLKPYADFESMTRQRVETVRDLAGRRFDWDQALRDLSRAIPQDVTLASLKGDLGPGAGGSASASASSGLRGAIDSPALDLQGCTTNQREVARLMARLRNIDGVTRVTLSKSVNVKSQDTATAAAGASGGLKCGTGARPSFELTVFFEGATAAVASPDAKSSAGSTATGPTATATPSASATPGASATATPTPASTTTTTASTTSQGGTTP